MDLEKMLDDLRACICVRWGALFSPTLLGSPPAPAPQNGGHAKEEEEEKEEEGQDDSPFRLRFLEASIWPEVVDALLGLGHALFPSGLPDAFHRHYLLCDGFIRGVAEGLASPQARHRLLAHPHTTKLNKRWGLPVYFQLRAQVSLVFSSFFFFFEPKMINVHTPI